MNALIELEEITKDFGAFRALDEVSLEIESGITGLLGPNGAGKSTLIKILLGLLRATSGRGRLLNFEFGRDKQQILARVGYMPEDDCFLYGLTGVESVQLSAQLSRFPQTEGLRRAHEILDYCGIAQERYRTVETYSSGMRQKLRFAQAIVHDPPVLILDEPTSGLDPEEREAMLGRIQRLARDQGKAVLLCTHILPDVQAISDAVVILARGRVQVADRLQELSRPTSPSIEVRLLGPPDQFLQKLGESGLSVETAVNGVLTVGGPEEQLSQRVWQAARECGVGVRSLTPSRNSLEEIFLNAVQEQPDDGA
jgi:ABC-2 type transport system ATP-binding protein